MLNIDGINIYTITMITCDEDLAGQIYVGREELKVRSIGHCAMLEEDAMHIGTEADVSAHVLDISGKKTQLRGLLDTGAVLSVITIETWERMGFDKDDLIDSTIRLSAAIKGALRVLGRTPIIALNLGERNLWMSFLVVENLDESDQFNLGRDFIRNFDVTIDLNNAMFRIWNPDRKYVIKPVNLIMANENKAPVYCPGSVKSGMKIRRRAAMTKIVYAWYWRKRRWDTATGSYRRILPQERTTWISRKCEEVKSLRKMQCRGNHLRSYRATQTSEQIWCQKMTGRS